MSRDEEIDVRDVDCQSVEYSKRLLESLGVKPNAHEPEQRLESRIIIVGEGSISHLAKLMLEGRKHNVGLYYAGIPCLGEPKPGLTTGIFELSMRDLYDPGIRMFGVRDSCARDRVLQVKSRKLSEILKPALSHSHQRDRNKGPRKHGQDARWK